MNKTTVNPITGQLDVTIFAGVIDGSAAAAGDIGEEIISTVSIYTNCGSTGTYKQITSITLTPGDWDISALGTFSVNSATLTTSANVILALSTTTASAAGTTEGLNIIYGPQNGLTATSKETIQINPNRISVTVNTTYYLNIQSTFTLGTPQYVGTLRARRIR